MTLSPERRGILQLVARRQPLNDSMRADVIALINEGYMHVTPELNRHDPCPYRLTDDGRRACYARA